MTKALNFTVEDDLKDDLTAYAARYGITIAAAARILLRNALDRWVRAVITPPGKSDR